MKGVYVIQFDNGIKIGISEDLANRATTYLYPWCREIVGFYALECQYPRHIENILKKEFNKYITGNSYEFLFGVDLERVLLHLFNKRFSRPTKTLVDKNYKNKELLKFVDGKFLTRKQCELLPPKETEEEMITRVKAKLKADTEAHTLVKLKIEEDSRRLVYEEI